MDVGQFFYGTLAMRYDIQNGEKASFADHMFNLLAKFRTELLDGNLSRSARLIYILKRRLKPGIILLLKSAITSSISIAILFIEYPLVSDTQREIRDDKH